jgi:HSP20 family protein
MLLPSIFENNFADGFFDDMFSFPMNRMTAASRWMNTDVQDLGDKYQLEIELPGYEKNDIHAQLQDGYLIISADKQDEKEEKDDNGKYLHKERYSGSCKRSFYVGENLKEENIHAAFDNGILKLVFPKEEAAKMEEKKYIQIE